MAKIIYLSAALIMLCLCGCRREKTGDSDRYLSALDEVITHRDKYRQDKERELLELKKRAARCTDDSTLFYAIGDIIDCYESYNSDSAFLYCARREAVARRSGRREFILNARMNTANIMNKTGMYKEALDRMDSVHSSELPDYLLPFYYHINRTLYGLLADYSIRREDRDNYSHLCASYRDSLIHLSSPGSLTYAITVADSLNNAQSPREAIAVISKYLARPDVGEHDKAISAYSLSESYRQLGEEDKMVRQLALSAISDMKANVKEYVSLPLLAGHLFEEGDIKRAHAYMSLAIEDAESYNARLRILEINNLYPKVNDMYLAMQEKQKTDMRRLLLIVSLLSVCLLGAGVMLWIQNVKLAKARNEAQEANTMLSEVNGRLQQTNAELRDANERLKVANHVIMENSSLKEAYIGQYMKQCSQQILKLDNFRRSLSKLLSSGKTEELRSRLRSTELVEEEFREFYDSFDKAFLKLFPTFVAEFNALLLPGEEILPKKPGTLNAELRIFALVRLGIDESTKIAEFLRYSVTTIYNYRTRVRNKAAGERDALEENVKRIGIRRESSAGND